MNFSLSSRLVRPRAANRTKRLKSVFFRQLVPLAPPAGGGRGSEQREGESRCFLGCRRHSRCVFHLRVHVCRACLERWQFSRSEEQKFGFVCEEEEEEVKVCKCKGRRRVNRKYAAKANQLSLYENHHHCCVLRFQTENLNLFSASFFFF